MLASYCYRRMELVANFIFIPVEQDVNTQIRHRYSHLHRVTGTFFGCALFIILFSGCWSLANESLTLWWTSSDIAGESLPFSTLLAQGIEQLNGKQISLITLPSSHHPVITFCHSYNECALSLNTKTAETINQSSPTDLLVALHKNLFAGFWGRIFISLFGFTLTILLITGLLLHARKLKSLLKLRVTKGYRLFIFDLHNVVGIINYPWLILFAFTGTLSGLGALGTVMLADKASPSSSSQVMQQLMGSYHQIDVPKPLAQNITLAELFTSIEKSQPQFYPQNLFIEPDKNQVTFGGFNQGLPSNNNFEQYRYRLSDGALLAIRSASQQSFWTRAFIAIQPLHYGQYEWLSEWKQALSITHFLAGFFACLLTLSGLALWCSRHIESLAARIICGLCGGLILAAAFLLASRFWADLPHLILFSSIWIATTLFSILMTNLYKTLFVITICSGLLLLITAVSDLFISQMQFIKIDSALLLCSFLLLFISAFLFYQHCLQQRKRSEICKTY